MYQRLQYIRTLIETINSETYNVINLFGERGIGKTCLGRVMKDQFSPREEYICGYFDLHQYAGMSPDAMVDALYDLCDLLTAKNIVSLYHFDIADHIHSDRKQRVPYTDRKILAHFDKADEVTGFVSEFIELPYVGAGLKIAKAVTRQLRKFRPQSEDGKALFQALQEKSNQDLEDYLPRALAMDANVSLQAHNKRVLILVENCDCLLGESTEWLYELISRMEHTTWLFLSREKLELTGLHAKFICVEKLNRREMEEFLKTEKNLLDPQELAWFIDLCDGNPLHVERAWEYISQQRSRLGKIDWEALRTKEYEAIAAEALRGMPADRKEMLFQLNLSRYFDEELFCSLFPGRIFPLQKEWFKSSLFTELEPGKTYCVQNSMREEILNHMDALGATVFCYRNLFRAEMDWLRRAAVSSAKVTVEEIGQHMQSLFLYGKHIGSISNYFDSLMDVKRVLVNGGQMYSFYREMQWLSTQRAESIRLSALKEVASMAVHLSDYSSARAAIRDGLALAQQNGDVESQLTFVSIQMNLEYIAPSAGKNAADECIRVAARYMDVLGANIKRIPYKTYILNMAKVKLYLAKEYVIKEDFDEAKAQLGYLFDLCSDPRKLSALSLYSYYGKAQEQMGEIFSALKDRRGALEMYEKALETYQVAEVLQPYWDSEFYLNFGLVHKRTAEGFFHLSQVSGEDRDAHIYTAIQHLDSALSKYEEVKGRVPEVIDTYCKMGFAYVTAAEYLWQEDRWNDALERYLLAAEDILKEALEQIEHNGGEHTNGNRQLANSRCIVTRTFGLYYARRNLPEEAERWFKKTLEAGQAAIHAAPGHPYGYMEAADGHLQYTLFLTRHGRREDARFIAEQSMNILMQADQNCDDQPATTRRIRRALEEILI